MMNKILVPLDGSDLAERALPCARLIAQGLSANLILMRAVVFPSDAKDILDQANVSDDVVFEQLAVEAKTYLSKVAEPLRVNGLAVREEIQCSPAAEAIVDYARDAGVDLVVMATHGYSGISRWTHGSTAERVLQSLDVPLLLVCAKKCIEEEKMACHRILIPLDGSSVAEQVLPHAVSIAQTMGAEIVLIRVPVAQVYGSLTGEWSVPLEGSFETANEVALAYLERVAGRLDATGLQVTTATRTGAVASVIVEYAEANQIDLIAMCTHGRTGLARWTLGSVADRVLRARCRPLLLVRAH